MELEFSKNKMPFIKLNENSTLAFSKLTMKGNFYTMLFFSGNSNSSMESRISFLADMLFNGTKNDLKNSTINLDLLKKILLVIQKYLDENNYFHQDFLKDFENDISTIDIESFEKSNVKVKVKTSKGRKGVKNVTRKM